MKFVKFKIFYVINWQSPSISLRHTERCIIDQSLLSYMKLDTFIKFKTDWTLDLIPATVFVIILCKMYEAHGDCCNENFC